MVPLRDRWFAYLCVLGCTVLSLLCAVWTLFADGWPGAVVFLLIAWFIGRFIGRPAAASLVSHPDYR